MEHHAQEIKDNPKVEDIISDIVANNSDIFENFDDDLYKLEHRMVLLRNPYIHGPGLGAII